MDKYIDIMKNKKEGKCSGSLIKSILFPSSFPTIPSHLTPGFYPYMFTSLGTQLLKVTPAVYPH